MQDKVVKTDQLYQNCYNWSYMTPNGMKFVPKFSKLIEVQLSWRNFCLYMAIRSSKLACKTGYEVNTLDSFLESLALRPYYPIIMHNHAIILLFHHMTYTSMHTWYKTRILWLIKSFTNLKPWFPCKGSNLCSKNTTSVGLFLSLLVFSFLLC